MASFGERAEHTMFGLGAVAGGAFLSGWNREARRQAVFAAATARAENAAAHAVADFQADDVMALRADLIATRAEGRRLQVIVDHLTTDATGQLPARRPMVLTAERAETEVRVALVYARAEVRGLLEEIDDLEDELAA
jgi:hypothetical protein